MEQQDNANQIMVKEKPKLYSFRWIILLCYTIAVFVNNISGEIYVSISNEIIGIYDTSETMVTMASTGFMIMHPLLSIPCSQFIVNYGWASSVNFGIILTILGGLLKLLANHSGFYIIVLGQILVGSGKPFILNSQATMAQNWFYAESRPVIITIMNILNLFSSVLTFMIPGWLVFRNYDFEETQQSIEKGKELMNDLNLLLLGFTLLLIPSLILLRSHPKTPPSKLVLEEEKSKNTFRTLFRIGKNKQFLLCFQAYAQFMGLTKSLMIVLAFLFKACGQGKKEVSLAGSIVNIDAVFSLMFIAVIVKKYSNHRKLIAIILMVLAISSLIIFYFCLMTENTVLIYISIGIVGLFIMPNVPILMDISCDSIFPINASFAVGIMYIGSRIFLVIFSQFLAVVVGGAQSNKGRVTLTFLIEVVLLTFSLFIFSFITVKRKATVVEDPIMDKSSFYNKQSKTSFIESTPISNIQIGKQDNNESLLELRAKQ